MVIDHGKIIAQGTSDQLKSQVGGERIEVTVSDGTTLERTAKVLAPLGVSAPVLSEGQTSLLMPVTGGVAVLRQALQVLDDEGIDVDDAGLRRPTLDDVFLTLTGRAPAEDDEPSTDSDKGVKA